MDASVSDTENGTPSADYGSAIPNETAPADYSDNPSTGIAVSFVPLAAVTILTTAIKRKKK